MEQKKKRILLAIFIIAILIVFVLAFLFLHKNSASTNALKTLNQTRIQQAIDKGEHYIVSMHSAKTIFADDYFDCGKSSIPCPQNESPLYRRTDAAIDAVLISREIKDYYIMQEQVQEADAFLKSQISLLQNKSIDFSYLSRDGAKGDYAFDLYVILAHLYNDKTMYQEAALSLKDYGWFNPDTTDTFRKITDESWGIILLAQFNVSKEIINHQLDIKVQEQDYFLNGAFDVGKKKMVAVHMLLMYSQLQEYGFDISPYKESFAISQEFLEKNMMSGIIEEQINTLYALMKSGYNDKGRIAALVSLILNKQSANGAFYLYPDSNTASSITTMRAILALNQVLNDK